MVRMGNGTAAAHANYVAGRSHLLTAPAPRVKEIESQLQRGFVFLRILSGGTLLLSLSWFALDVSGRDPHPQRQLRRKIRDAGAACRGGVDVNWMVSDHLSNTW